ncbi:hypothetical protein OG898_16960 [Streptomyces sp. NBC_00193]|uniref:hypothetical protein n=1 Tax=unclassified Streptomyces TaxID=2593676 RepID=UPI00224DBE9E|nr:MULTISPECIES: hypothetical protein [unclassified Streptomyces]MCX5126045.1 hypothetical protein [Streptomyces sp. NBC_00347]MCX5298156.1 hypothetical protein [Streptomyces sp. NBC_00193]
MAVDYGPGVFGLDYGVGVASPAALGALQVEYESLTDYKKRVDGLLEKLVGSPASDKKLADGTIPENSLGEGFAEAKRLFTAYSNVHTQLLALSKGLADQIEGLGIAIQTAGRGFGGVDEDTKRRMLAISKQAKENYVPERDPLAAPPPHSSDSQGATPGATQGGGF